MMASRTHAAARRLVDENFAAGDVRFAGVGHFQASCSSGTGALAVMSIAIVQHGVAFCLQQAKRAPSTMGTVNAVTDLRLNKHVLLFHVVTLAARAKPI
jgi:hypothetical protein